MRSPRIIVASLALLTCLLSFAVHARAAAPPPPGVTEKVDCNKGGSINKALSKNAGAASLVIEINGMCNENVVVRQDRVTLKGTDPSADGIQATANVTQADAALWVRGAQFVRVENLKLTGGYVGLLASDVSVPFLRVENCQIVGNVQYGAQLEGALVLAVNTIFGPNTRISVVALDASRFQCTGCTMVNDPASQARDNLVVQGGSQALLFETTLTNGGISSSNSTVTLTDSSVQAFADQFAPSLQGTVSSNFTLIRSQLEGPMRFSQGTTAGLFGVMQTAGQAQGNAPNVTDDASSVRVSDTSSADPNGPPVYSSVMGFILRNFGNASILQNTQVNGNLSCSLGGNAVCQTPANITGTANCGLCTKP